MVPSCKLNRLLRLHHREGNVIPLLYSCLEKSHGWRNLVGCSPWGCEESDMTERLHFHFPALEKEMATHSSVLAWRILGTGEPGGLPSMGSHRVGHDWSDLAFALQGGHLRGSADSYQWAWRHLASPSGTTPMWDKPSELWTVWASVLYLD